MSTGTKYVFENSARVLAGHAKSRLFLPLVDSVLRDDDVLFDPMYPKSAAHLLSWRGSTFGHVRTNRVHQGWDFFAFSGTECLAVGSGRVDSVYESKDLGLCMVVALDHHGKLDKPLYAAYCHLSEVLVGKHKRVHGGQPICRSGVSGNLREHQRYPHLHFEFRVLGGQYIGKGLANRVDPATYFGDPKTYRPHLRRVDPLSRGVPKGIA